MYRPPRPLATFLEFPNPAPIFIGFGALAIPDPVALTELIYDAARASGKRIVLQRGFADLGKGVENKPDNVCLVGTCPHSWLFARCSAAVHHGGAGTTAAALRAGLPTLVVRVCLLVVPITIFAFPAKLVAFNCSHCVPYELTTVEVCWY